MLVHWWPVEPEENLALGKPSTVMQTVGTMMVIRAIVLVVAGVLFVMDAPILRLVC